MEQKTVQLEKWQFALGEEAPRGREGWQEVRVPHDWVIGQNFDKDMEEGGPQGFRNRFGKAWYRCELPLEEVPADGVCRLYFDGVMEDSAVWVNGHAAGGRKYGYSSFFLDVTPWLNAGENEILVCANSTHAPADRWYSGGGIYRRAWFEALPKEHLEREDIAVTTRGGTVYIDTGTDLETEAVLQTDAGMYRAAGRRRLVLQAEQAGRWSAENPVLWPLCIRLTGSGHCVEFRIGIRDVEATARGLFVNGKKTELKGVCVHQDASCFGTAVPAEIWRERLLLLKEFGCNAIRPSHHIFMPEFLDLCDELGFYVYEECFDKWTGGAYGRYYRTEWERDIACMVKRDRNHPCILFWGVGNEVEFQGLSPMLERMEAHCRAVRALDGTRPVSCALSPHFKRETDVDISQVRDIQKFVDEVDENEIYDLAYRMDVMRKIADIVDVFACNYQEPWYALIRKCIPDTPILGTEVYQYFSGYPMPLQSYTESIPYRAVREHEGVLGGMIWAGFDYLGESMGWPAKGWAGALFTSDGEPKTGAYLLRSLWQEEPFVHFAVLDGSLRDAGVKEHWDMPPYVTHWDFPQITKAVVPFLIATNCDKVTVALNGNVLFSRRPSDYPNGIVTGCLPYTRGEITVEGERDGKKVCSHTVRTAGLAVELAFDRPQIRLEAKGEQTFLLKVRARDEDGTPVFRESAMVRFAVEGDAQIIGVDNGDIMGHEPYQNREIHLFRGRADVAVRVGKDAARVKVRAFADGMREAEAILYRASDREPSAV